MVGASSIAAISNALKGEIFPFVFGGDGATALIPESQKTLVEEALRAAQLMAKEQFDLDLRVGFISVKRLQQLRHEVKVGRYELPGGPSLAFLRGSGFEIAERMVKSGEGLMTSGPQQSLDVAMAGLSCRWAPLKSERDQMLSILIKSTAQGDLKNVLTQVARDIHRIVDLNSSNTHPIKFKKATSASPVEASRQEIKLLGLAKTNWPGLRFKFFFEMWVARFLLFTGWKIKGFDMRAYTESLAEHSDFKKYDSVLRMVIDCSTEMEREIRTILQEKNKRGLLYFGMHSSNSALITCFVKSTDSGGHIHFVDGSDGGYALAALEMKKQMAN